MTLNFNGQLYDINEPIVMGIINVTPDSFYAGSRLPVESESESSPTTLLVERAHRMLETGATILDVGAVSTRPGAEPVSADEEMDRLVPVLKVLRGNFPDVLLSVDTFRAAVASRVVRDFGVQLINDVSAGALDPEMFATVADLRVPYVLTHSGGFADAQLGASSDNSDQGQTSSSALLPAVARFFADHLQQLYALGVRDVILDPGFGFGKNLAENYELLRGLPELVRLFPDNPFLVGVSRKSMVYRLLNTTPDKALNGTTVLNTIALQAGAHILRVHDVPEAIEAVRITQALPPADFLNTR